MDSRDAYATHVYEPTLGGNTDTKQQLQTQLETFILDYRVDNHFVYRCVRYLPFKSVFELTKYLIRDQLRENALLKRYYCDVNISDLIGFNEELAHRLASEPAEIIPLVRKHLVDSLIEGASLTKMCF